MNELSSSLSVKVINDTAGPNGQNTALLVFGIISRILSVKACVPDQVKRIEAMRCTRDDTTRVMANERIKLVLLGIVLTVTDKKIYVRVKDLRYRKKLIAR